MAWKHSFATVDATMSDPLHLFLHLFEFFPIAFMALFPLMNPFGSAIIFLGMVGPADKTVYQRLARRIAFRTALFLIAIDLVGAVVLTFFGISLPVVEVAGGLVLASMGWRLLNRPDSELQAKRGQGEPTSLEVLDAKIFYPFTFPLTADPATVVVTLALAAHAEQPVTLNGVFNQLGMVLAILLLCVIVYFSYAYAPAISRRVSHQTIYGVLRIVAFLLLAIGIQIFWRGAVELLHQAFPQ